MTDVGDLDELKVGGFDCCPVNGFACKKMGGGSPVTGPLEAHKRNFLRPVGVVLNHPDRAKDILHPVREERAIVAEGVASRFPRVLDAPGLQKGAIFLKKLSLKEEVDAAYRDSLP